MACFKAGSYGKAIYLPIRIRADLEMASADIAHQLTDLHFEELQIEFEELGAKKDSVRNQAG